MKFYSPIDMGGLEIVQFRTQNNSAQPYAASGQKGAFWMDSSNNLLKWSDGTSWQAIYPLSISHVAGTSTAVLRDTSGNFGAGTITASLTGVATEATALQNSRNFSITGKATAAAVGFNGTSAVALNITSLTVVPGEITLANGSFIVGSSGVGSAVAKNTIPISGFAAAAADVDHGGYKITSLADPVADTDAANKRYVDSTAQGLDPKGSCRASTTADLGGTYSAGSQTITGPSVPLVIDGVTLAVGNRVLVKNSTTASQNGIYTVTAIGSYGSAWVLTRATDFNTSAKASPGSFTFIEEGTVYADTGWVMTADGTVALDTTSITWTQFSGAGSYSAGRGMALVGGQFNFAQASNYTANTIPYASGLTTIGFIGAGAAYQVLRVPAGGGAPAFGAIDISAVAAVTGTLAAANGGTGQSSYAIGDLLYASTSTALSKLADVAVGNALIAGGVGVAPAWGKITLTNHVSGILPIGNGGTGLSSWTTNGLFYGGASAMGQTAAPTTGQIVVGSAGGVPVFVSMSTDATITAAGALTIAANAVSFAKFQQIAGLSVFGNSTASAANGAAITGTANQVLRVDSAGTALGFGAINLANGNAVTGILPSVNGGTGTQYAQFTTGGSTLRTYSLTDRNAALAVQVSGTITGNAATTVFSATHNLNTKMVLAAVYDSNDDQIFVDTKTFDVNTVRFTFAVAPANAAAYRWVVIGY